MTIETETRTAVAEMLRARYGHAMELPAALLNPLVETVLSHRSIRAFSDKPIPEGTLELLVAAGSSAPTSSNLQTWSVVAVRDPGRKARLAELAAKQKFITQAPLFLVWLADLSRLERVGEAKGQKMEALEYLEMFLVAAIDAALAAQNAVLALESLGMGGVYVGALRNHPAEVAKELGLPPNVMAVFGLCIGYPDPAVATSIKPRLPQAVVLHEEQYSPRGEQEGVPHYDEVLMEFSNAHGMGQVDWSRRALTRAGKLSGLAGRDAMQEVLKGMGFGLK